MKSIAITALINQAISSNQGFDDKYVQYLWQPSEHDNIYINGDENRHIQVLSNLLSNAIKYTPKGSQVVIKTKHDIGKVRVSITDSGPGIPQAFKDRVFVKFTQADSSIKRQVEGTGLGLAITKKL